MRRIRQPFLWTAEGAVTHTASGTPQAETATSSGTVERILTVSGTPQAVTATSSGVVSVIGTKTVSGTPQAETATSSGVVNVTGVVTTASGTPQAETATSSGVVSLTATFGKFDRTQCIKPEAFGCIVKGETFGCSVPACNIPTSAAASNNVDNFLTVSGSPQADTATSTGVVNVPGSITVSGTPQAETATSSGVADSGAAQGAFVWLNPSTIVESSPGVPSTWDNDPSAGGGATYDMVIGTPVLPLTTALRNGRLTIKSAGQAGGGGFMTSASVADFASPYTIFFVGGFDVVANAAGLFDVEVSLANRVSMEAGTFPNSEIKLASVGAIASLARDNSPHVWAIRVDSTNHRARISGGAWQTSANANTNSYDYGTVLTNVNSGLNAAGWAGEVIIFSSALTDADMDWRFNKLKLDWSIP